MSSPVTVPRDGAPLSWGRLSTRLPAASRQSTPRFALLPRAAFALHIEPSLPQPTSFPSLLPFRFSPVPPGDTELPAGYRPGSNRAAALREVTAGGGAHGRDVTRGRLTQPPASRARRGPASACSCRWRSRSGSRSRRQHRQHGGRPAGEHAAAPLRRGVSAAAAAEGPAGAGGAGPAGRAPLRGTRPRVRGGGGGRGLRPPPPRAPPLGLRPAACPPSACEGQRAAGSSSVSLAEPRPSEQQPASPSASGRAGPCQN